MRIGKIGESAVTVPSPTCDAAGQVPAVSSDGWQSAPTAVGIASTPGGIVTVMFWTVSLRLE